MSERSNRRGHRNDNIVKDFTDLIVYKKAYEVSLEIHRFSLKLPKIEQYALGDQLRRASKSICANIAEGFGKQRASSPEFRRYIMIATGSADEMKVWLSYCCDLGYLERRQFDAWRDEYSVIARMLNGLREKWK